MKSANSNNPCLYCDTHQDKFLDTDFTGSCRTNETFVKMSKKKSKGCCRTPIFMSIPLHMVVIDILHMFLRISGVLMTLLLLELRKLDATEKTKTFKSFDRDSYKHLAAYEDLLASIGITGFSFYIGKESSILKYRELIGPEKLKLFNNLDRIRSLLDGLPSVTIYCNNRYCLFGSWLHLDCIGLAECVSNQMEISFEDTGSPEDSMMIDDEIETEGGASKNGKDKEVYHEESEGECNEGGTEEAEEDKNRMNGYRGKY